MDTNSYIFLGFAVSYLGILWALWHSVPKFKDDSNVQRKRMLWVHQEINKLRLKQHKKAA